jgi:hypothetical protein
MPAPVYRPSSRSGLVSPDLYYVGQESRFAPAFHIVVDGPVEAGGVLKTCDSAAGSSPTAPALPPQPYGCGVT